MVDETTGEVIPDGEEQEQKSWQRWDDHDEPDLAPTYRRSKQIEVLFAALAKAQATFTNAEKLGENPHFHSRYATLEAVVEATKQGRSENSLCVIQMPVNWQASIAVTTLLGHASGQWIESTIAVPPGRLDAQGAGSVITYLRRYALMSILGIAAEDDDGEAASSRPQQQGQQPQPQRPPTQPMSASQLATVEQRKALWSTLVRIWNGDKDSAKSWLDAEFTAIKPGMKPTDLTVGSLRVIMERAQSFARAEAPQEPAPEEPEDEFGFEAAQEEEQEKDKGKGKHKKDK